MDESLDPHLSYSKVLRLNSIWKRRKRCRNVPKILPIEWPTKVGNQRIASQILGGSKAMFLCFETPWKTMENTFPNIPCITGENQNRFPPPMFLGTHFHSHSRRNFLVLEPQAQPGPLWHSVIWVYLGMGQTNSS